MYIKNKVALILFLISPFITFSQSSKFEITILLKEEVKSIKIINDSLIYQEFILKEKFNYFKNDIHFDKKGVLQNKIEVPNVKTESYLTFIYKNINKENQPLVLNKLKVKNLLSYPKDFEGHKLNKFRSLLNKAKKIYIIESDSTVGYYIIKEVILKEKLEKL